MFRETKKIIDKFSKCRYLKENYECTHEGMTRKGLICIFVENYSKCRFYEEIAVETHRH
ncbi:MAG: hypothetical protein ACXQTP_03010 [Candidatus Methanofastidiosia archaeon]